MTRRIETINYSEFATLAQCETKWGYAYLLEQEEDVEGKNGLWLGTLLHLGLDRWTRDLGATLPEVWTDDINTGGKPGEMRTLRLSDFDSALVEHALWLLARYVSVYGSSRPESWNVISTEEWLTGKFKIGSRTVRIVGRHDGLVEILGDLWLIERKSYGQKRRLDTIGIEPQPTIYYDLVEQNYGRRPVGLLYDGIFTYRYSPKPPTQGALIEAAIVAGEQGKHIEGFPYNGTKSAQRDWARPLTLDPSLATERPPEDSFERRWIDRTPQAIAVGEQFLGNAIRRRDRIKVIEDTIPNVGKDCSWCGFRAECWSRLSGLDSSEILLAPEDDGDVPV